MKKSTTQKQRVLKAILITTALVMLVPAVSFAQEQAESTTRISTLAQTIVQASFDENVNENVNNIQTNADKTNGINTSQLASAMGVQIANEVPEQFNRECFDVSNKDDLLVNSQGNLVSFTSHEDAASTFSSVSQKLEKNGWNAAKTEGSTQATYLKDSGDIRWVYVECIGMGGETCVIVQTS